MLHLGLFGRNGTHVPTAAFESNGSIVATGLFSQLMRLDYSGQLFCLLQQVHLRQMSQLIQPDYLG